MPGLCPICHVADSTVHTLTFDLFPGTYTVKANVCHACAGTERSHYSNKLDFGGQTCLSTVQIASWACASREIHIRAVNRFKSLIIINAFQP